MNAPDHSSPGERRPCAGPSKGADTPNADMRDRRPFATIRRASMEALYFPHLSLPASTWVNPALLFFDRLAIIAPDRSGDPGLHDPRTRELLDRDMVRLATADGSWGGRSEQILLSYMLGLASGRRQGGAISRINVGKLAYGPLAAELERAGLLARTGGPWLEGPEWVVAHLMSYLALRIADHSRTPLPLVTDQRAAARTMIGSREATLDSRRLRAATRLLPVHRTRASPTSTSSARATATSSGRSATT